MVDIIVPRRREDFFDTNGEPTHRFVRWMESVTSVSNETTTVIETIVDNSEISLGLMVGPADLFRQQSQIDAASDRIEANEIDLATRPRMSDLFKTNQRIDELIDELITQLERLNAGSDAQQQSVCLQVQLLKQMQLLNLRTEEAFDTKTNEEDIE